MSEPFGWQSQVGQDQWAWEVLGMKCQGTFLDIGCNHTQKHSNSWTLETQFGWTGLRVDIAPCEGPPRQSPFLLSDARKLDWSFFLQTNGLWPLVDYLSLDTEPVTLEVLCMLPLWSGWGFQAATIEHDSYSLGPGQRDAMRCLLSSHGYRLERADVADNGNPFEDWWVPRS